MLNNKKPIYQFLFILFFFAFLASCGVHKKNDNVLMAKMKNNKFELLIDTVKFKKNISESIFSSESEIVFDKIEVVKQFTLGEKSIPFYYIMLSDFDKKVKTTRLLIEKDNSLFLTNTQGNIDSSELIYLTCSGSKNCEPNIYYLEGKKTSGG